MKIDRIVSNGIC